MWLYYAFQIHILRTKARLSKAYLERGERFDRYFGEDREMLAADRVQLNMLEHMPAFLVLLWLHAVAGSAVIRPEHTQTTDRLAYPFVLGGRLGRGVPKRLLFVTFAGYGVLLYHAVRIGMALR